jgi:hypothetical protein
MVCIRTNAWLIAIEFEYESDAGMSESDSNEERANENLFYDAEDLRNSNPTKSLDMFRSLTNSPSCGSAWYVFHFSCSSCRRKFKALVQVINLGARLGRNASISRDLDDLFNVIDGVPRNEAVDGLSCVVDSVRISLSQSHIPPRSVHFLRTPPSRSSPHTLCCYKDSRRLLTCILFVSTCLCDWHASCSNRGVIPAISSCPNSCTT